MIRKSIFCIFIVFLAFTSIGLAQENHLHIDTVEVQRTAKPKEHLIGFKYSYDFSTAMTSPNLKTNIVKTPLNFSLLYTYYHPLWGYLDYFGIQTGIRYTSYGFTSLANLADVDETVTAIEVPFLSAFTIDAGKWIRVLISAGIFGGYRLSTDSEGGWDVYDMRYDFGVQGGLGIGIKIHPIEIHIEAGYNYSFMPLYHPQRTNSIYWVEINPSRFNAGIGIHYNFGNGKNNSKHKRFKNR